MGSTYNTTGRTYSQSDREPANTGAVDAQLDQMLGDDGESAERDEVDESYDGFIGDTSITDLQGETISDRRDVLEEILREDLNVKDSQLIGSFTRDTMVGPLTQESDADVMIVLDADSHREWIEQENGPRNCLRAIKRRIQNDPRFAETDVEIDQNVVQVKYHDSTIEIAPAFDYSEVPHADHPKSGLSIFTDASDGYAIPDTHGRQSWMGTNPRRYKQMFDARNDAHDGKVAGVTRAMKTWADNNDVPVRSYQMEVMVYNYFEEKAQTGQPVPDSYEECVRDFVDTLPSRMRSSTREPVYDEAVDEGMSRSERRQASEQAQQMRDALHEANRLKEEGKHEEAKAKLKEALGDGFN